MQKLSLYFLFYRGTFLPPLLGALFVYFVNGLIGLSILISISVLLILYGYRRIFDDPRRKKLYFYFNQGFTELKLYTFVALCNLSILTFIFLFV